MREDYGSHTEADAGAFAAAHAEPYSRLEQALDAGYDPEPEPSEFSGGLSFNDAFAAEAEEWARVANERARAERYAAEADKRERAT